MRATGSFVVAIACLTGFAAHAAPPPMPTSAPTMVPVVPTALPTATATLAKPSLLPAPPVLGAPQVAAATR